ncbi:MAG: cache domain-containing protein, partial [Candidatus Tectomicrobia bacterium]|nr:cache domain-containing protein [Candidatus Tectomicrobia bacterium]
MSPFHLGPTKQIVWIITIAFFLIAAIGYTSWRNNKRFIATKIEEFQQSQLDFARQIAEKVHTKFENLHDALYSLSQMPVVQFLDKNQCLLNMIRVFRMKKNLVEGIFRVDTANQVRYAYPADVHAFTSEELQPVFSQARMTGKSISKVIRRHQDNIDVLVITRPIYTVQGEVHLNPSNKFSGLLLFTIPLHKLQENILAQTHVNSNGSLWVINDQGLIVGTPNEEMLGKSIDEIIPETLAQNKPGHISYIIEKMRTGEEGYSYSFFNLTAMNDKEDFSYSDAEFPIDQKKMPTKTT